MNRAVLTALLGASSLVVVACGGSPDGNEKSAQSTNALMNTGGGTHVSCQFTPDECGDPFGSQWGGGGGSNGTGEPGGGSGVDVPTGGGDTGACINTCDANTTQLCYPQCYAHPGATVIVPSPWGYLPSGYIPDPTAALPLCLQSCGNDQASCQLDCTTH